MTERTTTSRGDTVAYDLHGDHPHADHPHGDRPGLVFVAGAGPFRAVDPVTTETARRVAEHGVRAVVFDRLGRGESPADGVLDLERELAAVAAAIAVADGGTGRGAVLCGHSSGCSIALAAVHAGLPVTGLVLWETPLGDDAAATKAWIDEFERRLDAEDFVGATEQYMVDMPPVWLEEMRRAPDFAEQARRSRSQRADGQSLVWATAAVEDGSLASVDVPVLAVYGTSTFPVMPAAAEKIAAVVPRTEVREVEGEFHSWDPAAMADTLVAFVRSTATRPTP
ncbi:alpha/beta fold hydrolase [Cellulosimicrobium marinum]|uniref:alpha/beta fold hydrolase n=1 Tax=Cellulosimicrobium marinum TaxID=1638992 RepID=UPI001E617886|nr:alpha/beta hydrolase [Cellulosimicrobium marinum]MCB7135898.1 alpha/beta hydrolase [Cellulosimicrobium marinum]